MSGFPILSIPPALLEKCISKTEPRSYFKLQQTGHAVSEFIQQSRNISVHIEGEYELGINEQHNTQLLKLNPISKLAIDGASCYGIRFEELELQEWRFEKAYEFLTKYRLTCNELRMYNKFWNNDRCTFIKLLKPIKIEMFEVTGDLTNDLDVLLTPRTVKSLTIYVDHLNSVNTTRQLFPLYEEIRISLIRTISDHFRHLRSILQILRSNPWPNLKRFSFSMLGEILQSPEQFEQQFHDLDGNPRLLEAEDWREELTLVIDLPQGFPQEASCKIVADRRMFSIHYEID